MNFSETNLLLNNSKTKREDKKLSTLFTIVCVMDVFGVFPVITLPKSIIDCGVYGVIMVAVICLIQIYTAILLGKCWIIAEKMDKTVDEKNRYPYTALAEITYGKIFSNVVSFSVNLTIFFGGIPNLIVASQNLQLLTLRLSHDNINVSFCYWILAIGMVLCPILWLGSPKDMKLLCSISVSIVVAVFVIISGCLIFTSEENLKNNDIFESERPLWELLFVSFGIISFQYDIHPSVLTIQVDMQEKSKLNLALTSAFATSLGMFSIVTLIAVIKFGASTRASLLETLPTTIPLHFAAFFVALQLCLSLAVSNSALFQHMEDCMSIPRVFNHRRCILRTTLTLLAVLIAESLPRFDLVMSLIGGTLTGPLVFLLPPMFYLKMLVLERRHTENFALETFVHDENEINGIAVIDFLGKKSWMMNKKFDVVCCVVIIMFSLFCIPATTYVNIKNAVAFTYFTQPCMFNVSAILINL